MNPVHVSFVVACTALVASTVGPIVSLKVSRRQFNASVLSANREKWIASLRESIAELISLMVAMNLRKANLAHAWTSPHAMFAQDDALLGKLERIVLLNWNIQLLANPNEEAHLALCQSIDAATKRLRSDDPADLLTEADIERITQAAQPVLKAAWRRVKLGS